MLAKSEAAAGVAELWFYRTLLIAGVLVVAGLFLAFFLANRIVLFQRTDITSINLLYPDYACAPVVSQGLSSLNFKVAAQPRDVALRRRAEQLFILAAKIRRVFITDAGTGARHVQIFAEHQAARFLKPDLFLKLHRTHRRDRLEMMVKAGNAHAEIARDVFNLKRLVQMFRGAVRLPWKCGECLLRKPAYGSAAHPVLPLKADK